MPSSKHRQDDPPPAGAAKPQAAYHHGDLRMALIAAAEQLLAERGAEGFTLRECARRVGVSPAAPSHHFGNAAGLLAAIAEMGFEELSDTMEAALATAADAPASRLEAIADAYVKFALRRPGRFRVTFGSAIYARKVSGGALHVSAARAFGILEREVRSAISDPSRLRSATVFTWSLVHGLSTLLLDDRLSFLLDEAHAERDRKALVADVLTTLAASCR